jgi:DNA-binding GntR family transcriptional regulator
MSSRVGAGTEATVDEPEELFATLRKRITRHEIAPGGKLLEEDLSAEFGVSRSKVREALLLLQQRGLIDRIPNRGAMVTRFGFDEAAKLFPVREVLEGLCSRLATQNVAPESWQDMVELFGAPIERDVATGDLEGYLAKLLTLRNRTLAAADNAFVADALERIHDRTSMMVRRIVLLPGRIEIGLMEHRAVLAAMRKGDAAEAEAATRANIRSSFASLKKYQSFVL